MCRSGETGLMVAIFSLLLQLLGVPTAVAQRKPELSVPLGRWHVRDGSSTRSRRGIEILRLDELDAVWSLDLGGTLATEMLSWDESFYALITSGEGGVCLKRFDLVDGSVLAETPEMSCGAEPGMTVWGQQILVTLPGVGVEGFAITESELVSDWRLVRTKDLASPILEDKELFLREGTRVACYDWGEEKPRWQSDEGYIGDFALSGEELLVIWEGPDGLCLDALERESGRRLSRTKLPELAEREKALRPFVQANGRFVVVRMPGTWVVPSGQTRNTVVLLYMGPTAQSLQPDTYLHQSATPILDVTTLYLLDELGSKGEGLYVLRGQALALIAARSRNPDLFQSGPALNLSHDHLWYGGSAIRMRDLSIRRLESDGLLHSAITALDTMLFRNEAGDRVTALREPVTSSRIPPALDLSNGQAVIEPSEILEGRIVIDPEKGIVSCRDDSGGLVSRPLGRLLVVLDEDGLVRFTPSEVALLRGLNASGRNDFTRSCIELANDAAEAGLTDDLARYLNRAQAYGIEVSTLESLLETLQELRKSPRSVANGAHDKLIAKQDLHAKENRARYWLRLADVFDQDFETGQAALQGWLKNYDDHPEAIEWVRSKIPEEIRPKGELRPSDWTKFLIAQRREPIEIIDEMPPRKSIPRSREQQALEKAREDWREDLIGVKCGPLLIITPRQNPAQIANCLVVGQMVYGELERLFGDSRNTKRLLEIHLFETQEDFVSYGQKIGLGIIGNVAGFYSPQENISRLFVPSDDEKLFDVLDVLVHELTHHWMESCCPLVKEWKAFRLREGTGSFVVEGLATMMQELDYDPAKISVRSDPRRYSCLDFVANCPDHHLLPWKQILEGTQLDYARMMVTARQIPDLDVPTTWDLMAKPPPSTATLYYAQVGALVTYLWQVDDGAQRERLIDLISRYYRGRTERLKIEKFLKLDAEELGPAIRAWAKKTVHPGR